MSGPRNGIIPQTGACGELRTVRAGQEPRLGTSPRTGTDELRPAPQSRTTPDPCRRKNPRGRTSAAAPPLPEAARVGARVVHRTGRIGSSALQAPAGPKAARTGRDTEPGYVWAAPSPLRVPTVGSRPTEEVRAATRKAKKGNPAATRSRVGGATPNRPIHGTEKMRGRSMPSSPLARFLPKQCNPQAVRRAVVAPASSPAKVPAKSPAKTNGTSSFAERRAEHITGTSRNGNGRRPATAEQRQGHGGKTIGQRRNSRTATGRRQDSSGKTTERRQGDDRTPAEKQQGHGGETTGQQRKNSRDTAGKRQDSSGKTAERRQGDDRTAAEKQRSGGGTTAALTDEKRGDRSIPVPSPVAARRRAIARIPALGVPPAVNSRRSAPPCPRRCGSAFRGSRLPRGSASKGR